MSGGLGLGGHGKMVTRGSLVCLALLALAACSKSPTNQIGGGTAKIVAPVAHPNIYGRWEMTKDDNDYPKLRKALSITEKHFTGWPVIETDENGSIIFHFTQMSKTFEPGSPDIIQACYIQRTIWNPNKTGDTREFYIDCDEKPDYSGFGGSEFIYGPRKVKYNLRIFGQHFDRLRFQDHDGLTYYFERVSEDAPPKPKPKT